jgi:hypothetical protein
LDTIVSSSSFTRIQSVTTSRTKLLAAVWNPIFFFPVMLRFL